MLSDKYIGLIALKCLAQDVGECREKTGLPGHCDYGAVHFVLKKYCRIL
jgi:hypothetical protein